MDVVFALTVQAEAEVIKAADVAAAADLAEIKNEEIQE